MVGRLAGELGRRQRPEAVLAHHLRLAGDICIYGVKYQKYRKEIHLTYIHFYYVVLIS